MNTLPRLSLLAILLFGIPVAFAGAYPLGVGAFGGWDIPLVQEDIGSGPMYGVALGSAGSPTGERHFDCGDIQDILENLNAFEAAVKAGQFWVYGFGNEPTYDVTFSHIVLLIALAAGL